MRSGRIVTRKIFVVFALVQVRGLNILKSVFVMRFCFGESVIFVQLIVGLAYVFSFYKAELLKRKVLSFVRIKYGEKNVEEYAYRFSPLRGSQGCSC